MTILTLKLYGEADFRNTCVIHTIIVILVLMVMACLESLLEGSVIPPNKLYSDRNKGILFRAQWSDRKGWENAVQVKFS